LINLIAAKSRTSVNSLEDELESEGENAARESSEISNQSFIG